MKNYISLITILIIISVNSFSYSNSKDSTEKKTIPFIFPAFSLQIPSGDMAKRFGINSNIGAGFYIKTKSNVLFGIDAGFIFGKNVKENSMLSAIDIGPQTHIGNNGDIIYYQISERGFSIHLKAGYLFSNFSPNDNSGIFVLGGIAFLQHKIRLEDKIYPSIQISKDYLKGYDRLSNGIGLNALVGYQLMSNNKWLNLFIAYQFELYKTSSRRDYNFDTRQKDDKIRNDILHGIRIGWIIPFINRETQNYYYY